MTLRYSPNTTVRFDADSVYALAARAKAKGYRTTLDDDSGYLLMQQKLIPLSFLDLIEVQLKSMPLVYGDILSAESLFNAEFLDLLEADEREVLMPVVKELIEQGKVPFLVLRVKKTKAAAKDFAA